MRQNADRVKVAAGPQRLPELRGDKPVSVACRTSDCIRIPLRVNECNIYCASRCYLIAGVQIFVRDPAISHLLADQCTATIKASHLWVWSCSRRCLLQLVSQLLESEKPVDVQALLLELSKWFPELLEVVTHSVGVARRRHQCWAEILQRCLCLFMGDPPLNRRKYGGPTLSPLKVRLALLYGLVSLNLGSCHACHNLGCRLMLQLLHAGGLQAGLHHASAGLLQLPANMQEVPSTLSAQPILHPGLGFDSAHAERLLGQLLPGRTC